MAKIKLLKLPKMPKLPSKPARSSSLQAKKNWIERVNDLKAKYNAKLRETTKENDRRKKENADAERLHRVISGVDRVKVFHSGISAKIVRPSKARHKKAKVKPVRKKAAKKVARKTAKRRR